MFELDSYTCSFLFNFEFVFDLDPKLLKFFLNSNSKFEFNPPYVPE